MMARPQKGKLPPLSEQQLALLRFIEWLDVSREVVEWGRPDDAHMATVDRYIAALKADQA